MELMVLIQWMVGTSIKKMTNYHLKKGTTSILPTTWTSTFEHTFNALKRI